MVKLIVRITLSIMILYISTLSKVEACDCAHVMTSLHSHCQDEFTDNTHNTQHVKCQCDQQTSNTLASINKPAILLTTKHFSLVLTADNTFRSQIRNTIYRPPIFI